MQLGHLLIGLLIASVDWNMKTVLLVTLFSLLPNVDVFFVWFKLVPPQYHCANSFTHTTAFALTVSGIIALFSPKYALFALTSIIVHLFADCPTNTGIMFFYPFSKRKYSLNLWKETGFGTWKSMKGYYTQKWAYILEGAVLLALIIRVFI